MMHAGSGTFDVPAPGKSVDRFVTGAAGNVAGSEGRSSNSNSSQETSAESPGVVGGLCEDPGSRILQRKEEEVAERIQNMQLRYLETGKVGYVAANAVTNWKNVVAVEISLSLQGTEKAGEGGAKLTRTMTHVVTLRNRTS